MEIAILEAQITELVGHLNAANYRLLTPLAEFDRRKGWHDSATRSCAHWLNWKCGINLGAAREKIRVAHALTSLPKISEAMERGELSYARLPHHQSIAACRGRCAIQEGARRSSRSGVQGTARFRGNVRRSF